jgi:hypothetical protein
MAFSPYIEGVHPLSASKIDLHVQSLPISYYGISLTSEADQRINSGPICIEDNSESYPYSTLLSGNPAEADKILIKAMSWSDHPGRGFESLREAMIADPANKLAVVGVSYPGMGLDSPPMTKKHKESLRGPNGDFAFIGSQQWQAIYQVLEAELAFYGSLSADTETKIKDYEFIVSGSSLGSSQTVGLLQSRPEWANIVGVGLAEATDLAHTTEVKSIRHLGRQALFSALYMKEGGDHFKEYTAVNPYNQYAALGPEHRFPVVVNALLRPASHIGKTIGVMVRGNTLDKMQRALEEKELRGISIKLRSGELDKLCRPRDLNRVAKALAKVADVDIKIHNNHYHPYLENLANAQQEFRSFTR